MTHISDQFHTCPFCQVEIRGPAIGRHIPACEKRESYAAKVRRLSVNGENPKIAAALHATANDLRALAAKLDATAAGLS